MFGGILLIGVRQLIKFLLLNTFLLFVLFAFVNCSNPANTTSSSSMCVSNSGSKVISDKIYLNGSSNPTGAPRWANATINWYYNPAGQPSNFSTSTVLSMIQTAIAKWEKVCSIKWVYQGTTTKSQTTHGDNYPVIGWGNASGVFGYTVTQWNQNAALTDGDIELSTTYLTDTDYFLGTMTHELGHQLGLQHSNVQNSVMYAAPYNSVIFEQTLRPDDIDACVGLYGTPSSPTPSSGSGTAVAGSSACP